ncbi:hypothetical protein C0J52_22786 [Blattella germanica]|nr:hypothetical protein C0J52_22786 [Blattella germanica]
MKNLKKTQDVSFTDACIPQLLHGVEWVQRLFWTYKITTFLFISVLSPKQGILIKFDVHMYLKLNKYRLKPFSFGTFVTFMYRVIEV